MPNVAKIRQIQYLTDLFGLETWKSRGIQIFEIETFTLSHQTISPSRGEQLSFFGCDGMLMFFFRKHWHQWFFDGFATPWLSPFYVFQPTDHCYQWFFDGFGITQLLPLNDFRPPDHCFRWFSDFRHQWSTMVLKFTPKVWSVKKRI